MIISQIKKDGDEFVVGIPEADMKRLGFREGDLIRSTFHKIADQPISDEPQSGSESRKDHSKPDTES